MHSQHPREFDDDPHPVKRCDVIALRIIADWIAKHDGMAINLDAVIDRDFVVVEAPHY